MKPVILGLTGSIGMGKSTVARMFADAGVPVFDADAAVHRLQGPEGALVDEIEAAFPGTTDSAGVKRHASAKRPVNSPPLSSVLRKNSQVCGQPLVPAVSAMSQPARLFVYSGLWKGFSNQAAVLVTISRR